MDTTTNLTNHQTLDPLTQVGVVVLGYRGKHLMPVGVQLQPDIFAVKAHSSNRSGIKRFEKPELESGPKYRVFLPGREFVGPLRNSGRRDIKRPSCCGDGSAEEGESVFFLHGGQHKACYMPPSSMRNDNRRMVSVMQIGERIRKLREEAGVSPQDMARSANVTVSALHQIETGKTKNPRPETLMGIARKLGRSMESLVDPSVTTPSAGLSAQALSLARWFDALSEKQRRSALAALLLSMDAAPDDYVAKFLPPAPSVKK